MERSRAQRGVRSTGATVSAVCASWLLFGCGLPLAGLGVPSQDGSATFPGGGGGDGQAGWSGEAGPPAGDDAADPADVASGDDASDATIDVSGDEPDGGPQTGDAEGGAPDARPDPTTDGGDDDGDAGMPQKPSFVQVSYATPQLPQASLGVAYLLAQSAGDLNVVVVGWNDSVTQVRSVTDTAGNVYAPAVGPTVNVGIFTQSIYYASDIAASARNNVVTVQFSAPAPAIDLRILEYKGIDPVDPLDVGAGAMGTGSTASAGPVVTTAPDLLVAANIVELYTLGPGPGFTQRVLTSPDSDIVEDVFAPSPGPYVATTPISPATRWVMQIAAFRAK